MSGDRVHVRVERLVLDGLAVAPAERAAVVAALEQELARLLREPGRVPDRLRTTSRVARLRGGADLAPADGDARAMGAGIARSVHAGMVQRPAARGARR
jgi:hypothetical protein